MTSNGFSASVKLSARLVLEFLSGRISPDQFKQFAFRNDDNLLETFLSRGMTIKAVRIEGAGLDDDDDHFVFELDFDAAASPLQKPKLTKPSK